jgi:hypothetical protein
MLGPLVIGRRNAREIKAGTKEAVNLRIAEEAARLERTDLQNGLANETDDGDDGDDNEDENDNQREDACEDEVNDRKGSELESNVGKETPPKSLKTRQTQECILTQ